MLGYNSTAVKVVSGQSGTGLESLLLTRLSDLKVYFVFVILYIFYMYRHMKFDISKKFIVYFVFVSTLTATSNQPMAFVPFLYFLIHYKNEYTQQERRLVK